MRSYPETSTTDINGTIFDIQRSSFVDGPGLRTTVFFKGCNLRCKWCHNPESHRGESEAMFYRDRCTHCGLCESISKADAEFICPNHAKIPCGKAVTVDEVLKECMKDRLFFDTSGGGVTFSGGECMLQIDFLESILKACKENGLSTAVDTAGHVSFDRFERILGCTDLVLYDIKCIDSDKHRLYTGADNLLILENLKRLLSLSRVWIRIPVIPSVNDTVEEMERIKHFLSLCERPEKIELLPYHSMGENKYSALNKKAHMFSTPDKEKIELLKKVFA